MRRHSIAAPLLLIGIGALLLARNLYPNLALADYIGTYWPFVLIAWGTLRLVEIIAWAAATKPLPRRGVSGGEWVLVVFLILIGSGFHAARRLPQDWSARIPWGSVDIFNEHYDYPVSADHAASAAPTVMIEDFRGDITINGSADNRVTLTGRKSIGAVNKTFADEANDASHFEITGDAGDVTIALRDGAPRRPVRITAALEISVPKGASVKARRRDGDVRVSGVDGTVVITGRGSNVDLENVAGPATVEGAFSGSIRARRVSKTMSFKGRNTQFTVESIPGDLSVDAGDFTATDLVGPMRITSRSNDVRVTGFTNSLEVSVDRGDLRLEPGRLPLSPIQVHSRSGDVRLALPEGAQFSINASTNSGDILNDFGAALKLDPSGPRQTLRGAIGNGPSIDIDTRRGDISISKASGVPGKAAVSENSTKKDMLQKIEQ